MTYRPSKVVNVTAEWALRGKTPTDRGYHVLDCSDGVLGKGNFEDLLFRYSPGTLETLPQVTISFVPSDQQDRNYLALAIHKRADHGQTDAVGREIVFISYFCVPFRDLAGNAVPYQTLYETFRAISLPVSGRFPISVDLAVRGLRAPTADDQVLRVAALLLTGKPVCILGADRVSLPDRLSFIDSAMSLLPYGMRSRMSASTWTSSTYQGHKFRLFFSDEVRGPYEPQEPEGGDWVVLWGQPDYSPIKHPYADIYLAWLENQVQRPVAQLAEQKDQAGFGQPDVLKMLRTLGVLDERPTLDYPIAEQDPGSLNGIIGWDAVPPARAMMSAEDLLASCADDLSTANIDGLRSDIAQLNKNLTDLVSFDEGRRERYWQRIKEHQLLQPQPQIGKLEEPFDGILLKLAFGTHLTYPNYCQVEDYLGARPGPSLLKAMRRMGFIESRTELIVLSYLDDKALRRLVGGIPVERLVAMAAGEDLRREHGRIVCAITLEILDRRERNLDPHDIQRILSRHGYLAKVLQWREPNDPQYQADVLGKLLRAAYGPRMQGPAIADVFSCTASAPTPALLAAVCWLIVERAGTGIVVERDDVRLVGREFFRALARNTGFDPSTSELLAGIFVDVDQRPPTPRAIEPPSLPAGPPGSALEPQRSLGEDNPKKGKKPGLRERYRDIMVQKVNRPG